IANGIVSGSGYSPAPAFGLDIYAGAREAADGGAGTNDVLVYHGSTDAPMVDVDELNVVMGEAVNDLSYTEFQGYLALGVDDYMLQVQAASTGGAVAAFDAPLANLGVDGAALTVLASGFLDPSMNSNGPAFGLFASTGVAGPLLELPMSMARIEVIHNSADAAAAVVDVFINDVETVPDFAFRTTTGFIDVPAGMPLSIEVAPDGAGLGGALPAIEIPFLASGETYIAIANGIVSGSGYSPAPAFGLDIYAGAREQAANQGMNETDVLVYHGSTDAPTVDVAETGVGAGTIVDDISYSEFQGYLELGTSNYELTIQNDLGTVDVASFQAPLQTLMLEDAAITVLASGFLDPSMNSNGAGFGLWVSLGTAGGLVPLSNVTGVNEVESISNAGLYPNPTNDNATMFFDLTEGENINLDVVNTMGQRVFTESFGNMTSGTHRVEIPANQMAPGFYFVNLRTNSGVVSTKMQVLR
ncbi:MAG: T9SS type A sorting domain-containing protein, partial [Flavobacteriales bacterium]